MDEQNQRILQITCAGNTVVPLEELHDLQGELKDLSEVNYVKLRNSITKFGFSFPIFYWEDQDGTKYTLDSHQRQRTLLKMQAEGWTIPPLPADPIHAKDKAEAKTKLLLLNSKFGKITQEGYDAFISDINVEEIGDMLALPDIWQENETVQDRQGVGGEPTHKHDQPIEVTCPACSHTFTVE
jgi:hypothetical protein